MKPTEHSVVIREMRESEYPLLATVPPFDREGIPNFGHSRVIVAQKHATGQVVGYWIIFDAIHIEPLWVAPSHRKNPGLLRRMWFGVKRVLCEVSAKRAFAIILDADADENLPQTMRMGFRKLPGSLYFVDISKFGEGAVGRDMRRKAG
jgi:hypothetical protein